MIREQTSLLFFKWNPRKYIIFGFIILKASISTLSPILIKETQIPIKQTALPRLSANDFISQAYRNREV